MTASLEDILGTGVDIGVYRLWTFEAPDGTNPGELRDLVLRAKGMTRSDLPVAIVGGAINEGKLALVAAANEEAQRLGLGANDLLKAALETVGGRGGGKADVAQGGGTQPEKIGEGFAAAAEYVRSLSGS